MVPAHRAEDPRLDRLLQPLQRFIEEIVLHDPQDAVVHSGRLEYLVGFAQVTAHRLLQVQMPAVGQHLTDSFGVERDRKQDLGRIDCQAARREVSCCGEPRALRPVGLAMGTTLRIGIDQRNNLDVRIVNIRSDVQIVDAAEAYEGGPYRPVVGNERHDGLPSFVSLTLAPSASAH